MTKASQVPLLTHANPNAEGAQEQGQNSAGSGKGPSKAKTMSRFGRRARQTGEKEEAQAECPPMLVFEHCHDTPMEGASEVTNAFVFGNSKFVCNSLFVQHVHFMCRLFLPLTC